jgi:multiple sugar transport system permease protein
MILSSFKPNIEIMSPKFSVLPLKWSLEHYVTVLTELPLGRAYVNSLIVSSIVTLSVLFTSTAAGFLFSKFRFKGRDALFFLVLASVMLPPQIMIVPLYFMASKLDMINTYPGIFFPFLMSPFAIFLMRQFIYGIPTDLVEAARVDGASDWRIYFNVILPLAKPALAVVGILIFLWSWDEFLWPLVVVGQVEMMTLPLLLGRFTMAEGTFAGQSMAATTLVIGPVLIVYAFFQRHFVKGISLTGLKG